MEMNGYYRMEVNSKVFALPILTGIISNVIAKGRCSQTGIANALEFTFIL